MPITLEIKVVPSSGRQGFVIDKLGKLKCFLKNPAEQGKANDELITLLSKLLKIPKNAIRILLGATSRKKIVQITTTLSYEQIIAQLGIEQQTSLLK